MVGICLCLKAITGSCGLDNCIFLHINCVCRLSNGIEQLSTVFVINWLHCFVIERQCSNSHCIFFYLIAIVITCFDRITNDNKRLLIVSIGPLMVRLLLLASCGMNLIVGSRISWASQPASQPAAISQPCSQPSASQTTSQTTSSQPVVEVCTTEHVRSVIDRWFAFCKLYGGLAFSIALSSEGKQWFWSCWEYAKDQFNVGLTNVFRRIGRS